MSLDWSFIAAHAKDFLIALLLTLKISFFGILGAVIVGFLTALVNFYRIPVLQVFVRAYLSVSRNTPLLIHLFFLYYGLAQLELHLHAYACAIIGVIFLGGSYMSESFLLGFLAVPRIQRESAAALGLSHTKILFYIILPQSIAISAPSLGANTIFLLKETSVVSAIALADIVFVTKDLIGAYYKTNEALSLLVLTYLLVLLPLSILLVWLEKHYKKGLA